MSNSIYAETFNETTSKNLIAYGDNTNGNIKPSPAAATPNKTNPAAAANTESILNP
jgi:hypothetical protein